MYKNIWKDGSEDSVRAAASGIAERTLRGGGKVADKRAFETGGG